jgi:hypothetical protein
MPNKRRSGRKNARNQRGQAQRSPGTGLPGWSQEGDTWTRKLGQLMKLTVRRGKYGYMGFGNGYVGESFTLDLAETLEEAQRELEATWQATSRQLPPPHHPLRSS